MPMTATAGPSIARLDDARATPAELRGPTAPAIPTYDDDDQVLQNAAFGLAQVNVNRPKRTQSRLTKLIGNKKHASVVPSATTKRRASLSKPSVKPSLANRIEQCMHFAEFADAVIVMVLVLLRIGFFFDSHNHPSHRHAWSNTLTAFAVLDAVSALINVLPTAANHLSMRLAKASSRRGSDPKVVSDVTTFRMMSRISRAPSRIVPDHLPNKRRLSMDEDTRTASHQDKDSATSRGRPAAGKKERGRRSCFHPQAISRLVWVLMGFPWELVCLAAGETNLSHVIGLARLLVAFYRIPILFSKGVLKMFRTSKVIRSLSFSTVSLAFHLGWIGVYLCHISASGYMFIAHYECGLDFSLCIKTPLPGNWVLKDNLEKGTVWRQYVRTMYWASKTITTLGQGDLVPATVLETNYCVFIQYVSGLWATSFLSACGFAFSRRDANMRQSTAARFKQSLQFVLARMLSRKAHQDVTSYFRYMQRTRNGIDEASVLAGLPTRYRAQCSHQIKLSCVKRHQGAFLRAIIDALEDDFFAPDQVIVDFNDVEEFLIVSTGEVRVSNTEKIFMKRLLPGNFHVDHALLRASLSCNQLIAESPTELWWLPRRSFEGIVISFFPADKRESILGRSPSYGHTTGLPSPEPAESNAAKDLALHKLMGKVDRDAEKSFKSVSAWRLPHSRFRFRCRVGHCMYLLFVALEVPIHIAFYRDFSIWDVSDSSADVLGVIGFIIALTAEVFFSINWYLRAYVFVRRTSDSDDAGGLRNSQTEKVQGHSHDLIVESKQICRHYLENDDIAIDFFSNLPIAFIWNIIPKTTVSSTSITYVRFFRLFRLVRLPALRNELRIVMSEKI